MIKLLNKITGIEKYKNYQEIIHPIPTERICDNFKNCDDCNFQTQCDYKPFIIKISKFFSNLYWNLTLDLKEWYEKKFKSDKLYICANCGKMLFVEKGISISSEYGWFLGKYYNICHHCNEHLNDVFYQFDDKLKKWCWIEKGLSNPIIQKSIQEQREYTKVDNAIAKERIGLNSFMKLKWNHDEHICFIDDFKVNNLDKKELMERYYRIDKIIRGEL